MASKLKDIKKTELHIHLGGSWPIQYLKTISTSEEYSKLNDFLNKIDDTIDYHEGFEVFGLVSKLVNTEQKVKDGTIALINDLVSDNVTYVEIRTGLKDFGNGMESYLNAVLRGIEIGCQTNLNKIIVKLILSLRRDTSNEVAKFTLDCIKKYRSVIVGLDISGVC
jgi:adenosine deaminase